MAENWLIMAHNGLYWLIIAENWLIMAENCLITAHFLLTAATYPIVCQVKKVLDFG